jgi:hypothetical protein
MRASGRACNSGLRKPPLRPQRLAAADQGRTRPASVPPLAGNGYRDQRRPGSGGCEAEANKRGQRTPFSRIPERPFEAMIFPSANGHYNTLKFHHSLAVLWQYAKGWAARARKPARFSRSWG